MRREGGWGCGVRGVEWRGSRTRACGLLGRPGGRAFRGPGRQEPKKRTRMAVYRPAAPMILAGTAFGRSAAQQGGDGPLEDGPDDRARNQQHEPSDKHQGEPARSRAALQRGADLRGQLPDRGFHVRGALRRAFVALGSVFVNLGDLRPECGFQVRRALRRAFVALGSVFVNLGDLRPECGFQVRRALCRAFVALGGVFVNLGDLRPECGFQVRRALRRAFVALGGVVRSSTLAISARETRFPGPSVRFRSVRALAARSSTLAISARSVGASGPPSALCWFLLRR